MKNSVAILTPAGDPERMLLLGFASTLPNVSAPTQSPSHVHHGITIFDLHNKATNSGLFQHRVIGYGGSNGVTAIFVT